MNTMVTQHGFHYTDPTMHPWLHYDPNRLEFTGIGPYVAEEESFLYDVYGYDINNNWANTTFSIHVTPNYVCEAKDQYNFTCEYGNYCTFTILNDFFTQEDQDHLIVAINNPITIDWLSYSTLNKSFHGNPPFTPLPPTQFTLTATDPFMASCELIVEMTMNFTGDDNDRILW